ncbi:MAG: dihydroorotase [Bacteroidales bacterium]
MMKTIITNARIVNEGRIWNGNLIILDGIIHEITNNVESIDSNDYDLVFDAGGNLLIPGIIDDQVHFREPGLTYKADIYTESKAAVAGGITSFMEMPNTNPQTVTQDLLEEKYDLASKKSLANYSFYIGATNDNIEELVKTNPRAVCGIKIFMGASTGNMLVDNPETLRKIFEFAPLLVAVHCEDEETIRHNSEIFKQKYGDNLPIEYHPLIRSEEACYKSSGLAVELAKRYNTRLHVLHLSTAKELSLFNNQIPIKEKRITAEVCIHHLWFDNEDYKEKGSKIKWNPAIKTKIDKEALFQAIMNNTIDVIATDHAPHTLDEKSQTYFKCPSGGPLVQHSLPAMLEFYHLGKISLEKIVEKMCHTPADIFNIAKRGYIRKGYWADLTIVDLNHPWKVQKDNILYKCGWSPFEGYTFKSKIVQTFINGHLAYNNGIFNESNKGMRLLFNR